MKGRTTTCIKEAVPYEGVGGVAFFEQASTPNAFDLVDSLLVSALDVPCLDNSTLFLLTTTGSVEQDANALDLVYSPLVSALALPCPYNSTAPLFLRTTTVSVQQDTEVVYGFRVDGGRYHFLPTFANPRLACLLLFACRWPNVFSSSVHPKEEPPSGLLLPLQGGRPSRQEGLF